LARRQEIFRFDWHHAHSSFSLLNLLGLFIEPAGLSVGSYLQFLLVSKIQNHSNLVVVTDKERAKVFVVEAHKPKSEFAVCERARTFAKYFINAAVARRFYFLLLIRVEHYF
jgi:hypothetical protein